jgi:hypothetical protein
MELNKSVDLRGLSDEHMTELNRLGGVPDEVRGPIYERRRADYANRPYALEQIDIFDSSSPYGVALNLYKDTLKGDDTHGQEILIAWFAENYPLIEEFGSTHSS